MKIFISQSNYLPWRGFFDILSRVDLYIVYDSMQYTKNDWRNRNLVSNDNKLQWITIPCGAKISRSIDEVYPAQNNWAAKHFSTLQHLYSRSKYWNEYKESLSHIYSSMDANISLSCINIEFLRYIMRILGINTHIERDTELIDKTTLLNLERNERLIALCNEVQAKSYLTAPAAKSYLKTSLFRSRGIDIEFFSYPKYYLAQTQEPSSIDFLLKYNQLYI